MHVTNLLIVFIIGVVIISLVYINIDKLLILTIVFFSFNYTPLLFNGQRPDSLPLYLKFLRDIILLIIIINYLLKKVIMREMTFKVPKSVLWPLMLWSSYVISRSIHYDTTLIAVIRYIRYLIYYPLFFILILSSWKIKERYYVNIFKVLFYTGFVVFVLGWLDALTNFGYTYTTGTMIGNKLPFLRINTRAISTLGNPNNLGSYSGLILVILLVFEAEGVLEKFITRKFAFVLALLGLGSLLLSFSRGAVVAFVVVLPLVVYIYKSRGYTLKGSFRLFLIFILSVTMFLISTEVRGSFESFEARAIKIPYNIGLMNKHPWSYIIGLGVARGYKHGETLYSIIGTDYTKADNFYLLLFVETGIVGVILFGFFIFNISKSLLRFHNFLSSPSSRAICGAALGVIVYLLGWGISSVSFRLYPAGYFAWIMVGLAFSSARFYNKYKVS